MLTSSPSPTIQPGAHARSSTSYVGRAHYDGRLHKSPHPSATLPNPRSVHHSPQTPYKVKSPSLTPLSRSSSNTTANLPAVAQPQPPRPRMLDASTQYSPPFAPASRSSSFAPTSKVAGLRLHDSGHLSTSSDEQSSSQSTEGTVSSPAGQMKDKQPDQAGPASSASSTKRNAADPMDRTQEDGGRDAEDEQQASPKRPRTTTAMKVMPIQYETCDPRDLVVLISSMLMELIRYNDAIPLRDGHLTRFHSRAPPGISVVDYLQRLTTHATLSPPILLSMVYYIDRLCALYPAFTISSLTVHRFLITSATVASKGLSDSFWTNKTYARVGGVSLKELALLELEFLARVEWRIVPRPEVLIDYYRSLIERSDVYVIEDVKRVEMR